MKKNFFSALFLIFLLASCNAAEPASQNKPRTLTVFAAASLTDAFEEIGKLFEASHPGISVRFNFASSQSLRMQIEQGAQADIFASANKKEMDALTAGGFIQDAPQVFAFNQLVVILPPGNPANLETLEDLAKPEIKLILAAEEVPVGKYARQSLEKMDAQFGGGFLDKITANIVSNEDNVKQVAAKVQLGEADAGIVYSSDAIAASGLNSIEIPGELNVVAEYPIATVSGSPLREMAAEFIAYALSPDGRAVLEKWGFGKIR